MKNFSQIHGTFEDYCRERWGMVASMARRTAYQLMDAAQIVDNVRNCAQIPATESQARPLTRLEPDQQVAAWQQAVSIPDSGRTYEPNTFYYSMDFSE